MTYIYNKINKLDSSSGLLYPTAIPHNFASL